MSNLLYLIVFVLKSLSKNQLDYHYERCAIRHRPAYNARDTCNGVLMDGVENGLIA